MNTITLLIVICIIVILAISNIVSYNKGRNKGRKDSQSVIDSMLSSQDKAGNTLMTIPMKFTDATNRSYLTSATLTDCILNLIVMKIDGRDPIIMAIGGLTGGIRNELNNLFQFTTIQGSPGLSRTTNTLISDKNDKLNEILQGKKFTTTGVYNLCNKSMVPINIILDDGTLTIQSDVGLAGDTCSPNTYNVVYNCGPYPFIINQVS